MNGTSYDVRFWKIETRAGTNRTPYRVHWFVAGRHYTESFPIKALADAFRSELMAAWTKGETFRTETGRPVSHARASTDVSFLEHCREYVAVAWNDVAAKSRVSILGALVRVLPVVTRDLPGEPDPAVLRKALWKHLNQGHHAGQLDPEELRAIAWLEKASRPVSALTDESVVCDVVHALATNLDGSRSAPDYFSRRRRALHRAVAYAIRKKRLTANPLGKASLPDTWSPPDAPDDAVDPRSVGSPELVAGMLTACSYVGRTQGPRFVAFFACMYYAMMRPSEVAALTEDACHLPATGWGHFAAGRH